MPLKDESCWATDEQQYKQPMYIRLDQKEETKGCGYQKIS